MTKPHSIQRSIAKSTPAEKKVRNLFGALKSNIVAPLDEKWNAEK